MGHLYTAARRNAAVGAGTGADGVDVLLERHFDFVVLPDISKGKLTIIQPCLRPIHQNNRHLVSGIRHNGKGLIGTFFHSYLPRRVAIGFDRSVGARDSRNRIIGCRIKFAHELLLGGPVGVIPAPVSPHFKIVLAVPVVGLTPVGPVCVPVIDRNSARRTALALPENRTVILAFGTRNPFPNSLLVGVTGAQPAGFII